MTEVAPIHPNVSAVVAAAQAQGLDIEVREFPDGTRTAQDAAAAIGVDVAQIVKSLAFKVDDRIVMALVSGPDRLDEAKLAAAAGGDVVTRADADAVRAATGYPIGGVPPFGHRSPLPTFVDRHLLDHDEVWAAAGTPRHVFAITPADLVRLTGAPPADLAVG
ncbi:MAG TPA: YbaK/EbsC family protein [Acidimicrobiales bacterium]|jgi:Cys-tRNA(Pro) deacylase|nr:YbaK/EbsC family protein [Acidimicrobiales bacterium]